ncbi:MAG: pilin, partial [Patescibacteria group bacterium]
MKKVIITFIFLLFASLPTLTFAAEISDCDAGTVECNCETAALNGAVTEEYVFTSHGSVDTIEECQETCRSYSIAQTRFLRSYDISCKVLGTLTPISSGVIGALTETYEAIGEIYYADPQLGVKIPGLEFTPAYKSGKVIVTNYLGEYISGVYNWLIGAASLLAIILIMIGGVQYAVARGDAGKLTEAKKRIGNAVTGLILLIGAYLIAFLINPDLTTFQSLEIKYVEADPLVIR